MNFFNKDIPNIVINSNYEVEILEKRIKQLEQENKDLSQYRNKELVHLSKLADLKEKIGRLEMLNEMLLLIYNGKEDDELVKFNGKIYKIIKRVLEKSEDTVPNLTLSCIEIDLKKYSPKHEISSEKEV